MNSVILMGRLTADPELRTTNNGLNYCRFTVAVDRYTKGEEKKTDFINCVAWRQTAEFVERYFGKGKMIAVQGSIQTGSFTNKDGAKVYTTDVLVDKAHFCGDKGNTTAPARSNADFSTETDYSQYGTPDDDLPF
jgi:single-strand DNA-binding protein